MRFLLGLLVTALFWGCGPERVAGGSTSETSNGLVVQVFDRNGVPAARVRVRVRPVDYLAGGSPASQDKEHGVLDTATDDSGRVILSVPKFRLQIEGFASREAGQVLVDSGAASTQLRLAIPSKLKGKVVYGKGDGRARIQARGLEHATWANADGSFLLDFLPSGSLHLRIWVPTSGKSVDSSVGLTSGTTSDMGSMVPVVESYHPTDSVRVVLNTFDGGAVTSTRVDTVPILVRLEGADFPASARSDGSDIRVTDSAGHVLPYSWERWSKSAKIARIWVRVPAVLPRDSTQWFKVRWGDPQAGDVARPWAVFTSAAGWSGVWDLNHTYLDRSGRPRVEDASSWSDDGFLTGAVRRDAVAGLRFGQGQDGLIMAGSGANLTGNFTVLIRARPEKPGVILLGKGDSAWNHGMKEFFLGAASVPKISRRAGWYPTFMGWADTAYNSYSVSSQRVDSAAWTFLVARHVLGLGDSGGVDWFVDGTRTVANPTVYTSYEADRAADSLMFGYRHRAQDRFVGAMAEIWILSRAVSDDWVHLQTECRKDGGGSLVRLRRSF